MQGPRADFSCHGPKCRTEAGAPVYQDLPVSSKRCPVCGSKRLHRIFNAVNVASGLARATDRIATPALEEAFAKKSDGTAARLEAAKREAPPIAVPMNQLAGTLAKMGKPARLGETSRPVPRVAHPVQQAFAGRKVTPDVVVGSYNPKEVPK